MNKILVLYRDRDSDAGCNPIGSSFILKMKRKTLFYTLFLPILLLTPSSIEIRAAGNEDVRISEQTDLRLAAWNIRIMSNKSRSDAELMGIARTLADYDFIAIVELRDEMVLKRTQKSSRRWGRCMITSSALRSGEFPKNGMPSSTGPNLSVLSGTENSIQMRQMARMISFEIRTGQHSERVSLIFQ